MDSGVDTGNESNESLSIQTVDNAYGKLHANNNVINNNNTTTTTNLEIENAADTVSTVAIQFMTSPEAHYVSIPGTITVTNARTSGSALMCVNSFPKPEHFKLDFCGIEGFPKISSFSFPPPLPSVTTSSISSISNSKNALKQWSSSSYDISSHKPKRDIVPIRSCHRKIRFSPIEQSNRRKKQMCIFASTNNLEAVEKLLEENYSPDCSDEQGRTPLHLAACRGYEDMVRLLLRYGANPNVRDCIGNTPLHLAAVTSKTSIVALLLMAGTDILSTDYHGHNALQLAQTKLRVLQRCTASDINCIKGEVQACIGMLLNYLKKKERSEHSSEQMETLSNLCSRLTVSNSTNQIQDDLRNILVNIDTLNISQ